MSSTAHASVPTNFLMVVTAEQGQEANNQCRRPMAVLPQPERRLAPAQSLARSPFLTVIWVDCDRSHGV